VAQSWFLPDYVNFTNAAFDVARQQVGFISNNTNHADYNTTVNSWLEQRAHIQDAPLQLQEEYPEVAARMQAALTQLARPTLPSTAGMRLVPSPAQQSFVCASLGGEVAFDSTGAVVNLVVNGTHLADPRHALGQYRYQTFTDEDYTLFLQDFTSRVEQGCADPLNVDVECSNFRKVGMALANPVHRDLVPSLVALYAAPDNCTFVTQVSTKARSASKFTGGSARCCQPLLPVGFRLFWQATFPVEAQQNAGAPLSVWNTMALSPSRVNWTFVTTQKRPTRLAESLFVSFPLPADPSSWKVQVREARVIHSSLPGHVPVSPADLLRRMA
jgi:hypothetical protein